MKRWENIRKLEKWGQKGKENDKYPEEGMSRGPLFI